MDSILLSCLVYSIASIAVIWTAGAVYFDVGRASRPGGALAVAWIALAVGAFVLWQPAWKPFAVLAVLEAFFLWWWFSQQPSEERDWDTDFSRVAQVGLEGDTITVENVRNTEYPALQENTTRYEARSYHFSQLRGIDALILFWGSPWMCHPMFVFDFGPDGRLCISIEVRYRADQEYSFFRSLYRQQELTYVVSDERDAILRRTRYYQDLDLYLYRLDVETLGMRHFFLEYANSINLLAERPQWYHGVTANCTTSIYMQGRGRLRWDWRMLFNGKLDRLMYDRKLLDRRMPFDSLKEQSRINDVANRAREDDFGDYVRRELPGYRQ